MRHFEHVHDNQWWYSQHPERKWLDDDVTLVLVVNGQRCMMTHSQRGRDGRVTPSFRFDVDSDRAMWVRLRGRTVELEVEGTVAGSHPAETAYSAKAPVLVRQEPSRQKPALMHGHTSRGLEKRTTPTLFDAFLFCDWSASSTPRTGKDSVWLADAWFDETGTLSWGAVENHSTRLQAERVIHQRILQHRHAGRRTLVGLDFPFGYPASALPRLIAKATPGWRDLWRTLERRVVDQHDNSNNRFALANDLNAAVGEHWYWSCPPRQATATLRTTKVDRGDVAEFRVVEESLRRAGRRPFSVWQLFGNGSVGSQSIVGLPCCERLRADETLNLRVWPFETGFTAPTRTGTAANILVEVWPGAIAVDDSLHPIKDAAQVLSLVLWAAEHDVAGTLAKHFEVAMLCGENRRRAATVEGWILGWVGPS